MGGREAVRGEYSRGSTRGVQLTPKDLRIWNREAYHRLENDSFSVFVDNLPADISRRELYHLFCWTGRINDIYLGRKRKSGVIYLFAFVRYTTKGGALKAIAEMNQWRLRGKVITVGEAKYRRQFQMGGTVRKEITSPNGGEAVDSYQGNGVAAAKAMKEQPVRDHKNATEGNGPVKRIDVPVVEANMEWLARSLVGHTLHPVDLRSVKTVVSKNLPNIVDVREIGPCKVLVIFDTVQHAEGVFTFKMDNLLQVFHRISRWEESERCITRRAWLECYGIPLHAWAPETFKRIGGQWGNVVQCDVMTGEGASFEAGRIQVETGVFDVIREWMQIVVGKTVFEIFVKEVEPQEGGAVSMGRSRSVYAKNEVSGTAGTAMKKGEGSWDPAAELVTGRPTEAEHGEDRIVISDVLLNDVDVAFLKFKKDTVVPDSASTKDGEVAGLKGCEIVHEGESENTVTQV